MELQVLLTACLGLAFILLALVLRKGSSDKQKQGSYGKVKTHSPSLWSSVIRPREFQALLGYLLAGKGSSATLCSGLPYATEDQIVKDDAILHKLLKKVSRSFAAVIGDLPNTAAAPLRLSVGTFYLLLRALDTVEDDMDLEHFERFKDAGVAGEGTPPLLGKEGGVQVKQRLLRAFVARLDSPAGDEKLHGIGEGAEEELLRNFAALRRLIDRLPKGHRDVLSSICKEMGEGMATYLVRDLSEGTKDVADYERYCYFVAGLVGKGLSQLFLTSGYETAPQVQEQRLWEPMGAFLQVTNITRDYIEDVVDGRTFWPREIWFKHVPQLSDLRLDLEDTPARRARSLACLDDMIAHALNKVPACLEYLDALVSEPTLRFCAVPQVMAIATLAECYRNPKVFTGVVKIRKGLAVRLLGDCNAGDIRKYRWWFAHFAGKMHRTALAIPDGKGAECAEACARIIAHASKKQA